MQDRILELPKVDNIYESINVFKQLYNWYSPEEWLISENLFNVSNNIAMYRPDLISVGIRLNVQVNLFLRTLKVFDSKNKFNEMGKEIGCFALTESNAGVLSGLVVETLFEETFNGFTLWTPNGVYKNWISQGISAKYMLIFAKNNKNKKDIRIFLTKSDSENIERKQINNINISKTLDLAEIKLNNLELPNSSLLDMTVSLSGLELLNGIFYGRVMIAEAVSYSILGLINHCSKILTKDKYKDLEHHKILKDSKYDLETLINVMEASRDKILKKKDIYTINTFKILSVEKSLDWYFKIYKVFTTHALNYPLNFDDIILNKVAEGDTSVLRLSLIHHDLVKKGIFSSKFSFYQLLRIWYNPKYVLKNYINLSDELIEQSYNKQLYLSKL